MPGVGHGEHVRLGEVELAVDLVVELVARSADALAERVAALDHEAGDDAVEDDAVVQRVARLLAGGGVRPLDLAGREADEVLDGLRGVVAVEVDLDGAVVGVEGRDCGVNRHALILSRVDSSSRHEGFRLPPRFQPFRWQDGGVRCTTMEVEMSLSRKRRKELKRLRSSAEELWGNQQDVLEHANAVAREASRQLGHLTREEVVPRVRTGYESYVRPGVEQAQGPRTVRRRLAGAHARQRARLGARDRRHRQRRPRPSRGRARLAARRRRGQAEEGPASAPTSRSAPASSPRPASRTPCGRRSAPTTSCGSPTTSPMPSTHDRPRRRPSDRRRRRHRRTQAICLALVNATAPAVPAGPSSSSVRSVVAVPSGAATRCQH